MQISVLLYWPRVNGTLRPLLTHPLTRGICSTLLRPCGCVRFWTELWQRENKCKLRGMKDFNNVGEYVNYLSSGHYWPRVILGRTDWLTFSFTTNSASVGLLMELQSSRCRKWKNNASKPASTHQGRVRTRVTDSTPIASVSIQKGLFKAIV